MGDIVAAALYTRRTQAQFSVIIPSHLGCFKEILNRLSLSTSEEMKAMVILEEFEQHKI